MKVFTGSAAEWDERIARLYDPHLLQTWEWAQVKAAYGWQRIPVIWDDDAAAMLLKRHMTSQGLAARLSLLYAPRGPLFDVTDFHWETLLSDLESFARRQGAILLKIDPDLRLGGTGPDDDYDPYAEYGLKFQRYAQVRGWRFSESQVQFRNSVIVDLGESQAELLARMKPKTRYNIRLAEKKGVRVRTGTLDDLPMLYRMYAETSVRDGFVIRDESYYQTVWHTFMRHPGSGWIYPWAEPLVAEVDGEAVAGIFVFYFVGRAYYLYGMSSGAHREKMPNYLLQWEAIKRMQDRGRRLYDLWGAPDTLDESDPMWGVYRFKEGLGGHVRKTIGAWDYPASPLWYKAYTQLVPRLLDLMRLRGKAKTKQALD